MKKFILFLIYVLSVYASKGQIQTATFEDGTKINYEIISNKPDDSPKFNIGVGINLQNYYLKNIEDPLNDIGTNYIELSYNGKRFNSSIFYGSWGYGIDGVIFLSTFDKHKEKTVFLKQQSTGLHSRNVYTTKTDQIIRKHLGLHIGYNHLNYSKVYLDQNLDHPLVTFDGLKTNELFLGIAFVKKQNLRTVVVINKPRKTGAFKQFGLYSDVLLYTNTKSNIDFLTDYVGLRLYVDGSRSWYIRNATIGYYYKIGVQYGPLVYNIIPMLNLGLRVGI